MVKKTFGLILFFYAFSLLQTSFLIYFFDLNFILFFSIFINLFEGEKENFGYVAAVVGGFFLDIFSVRPFGFHLLILISASILIKMILKRHVKLPVLLKYGKTF